MPRHPRRTSQPVPPEEQAWRERDRTIRDAIDRLRLRQPLHPTNVARLKKGWKLIIGPETVAREAAAVLGTCDPDTIKEKHPELWREIKGLRSSQAEPVDLATSKGRRPLDTKIADLNQTIEDLKLDKRRMAALINDLIGRLVKADELIDELRSENRRLIKELSQIRPICSMPDSQ
jgi:hypothetical protein